MILVDTSVWVAHLRKRDSHLSALLSNGEVACHPYVIGELACGHLQNRKEILSLLQNLPSIPAIDLEELLVFVETNRLFGSGIGFVDIHLLASAKLSALPLWTLDQTLQSAARRLGLNYVI